MSYMHMVADIVYQHPLLIWQNKAKSSKLFTRRRRWSTGATELEHEVFHTREEEEEDAPPHKRRRRRNKAKSSMLFHTSNVQIPDGQLGPQNLMRVDFLHACLARAKAQAYGG